MRANYLAIFDYLCSKSAFLMQFVLYLSVDGRKIRRFGAHQRINCSEKLIKIVKFYAKICPEGWRNNLADKNFGVKGISCVILRFSLPLFFPNDDGERTR
jgi:hypothetical protein